MIMNDKQLLILGLLIDESCDPHIRKSLQADVVYPFYRYFKDFDPQNPSLHGNRLPHDFFSSAQNGPEISISAIVGKNGCGKSTLVDIMLRLLNNLSYELYVKENRAATFSFVMGVRASLYFSIGTVLYWLSQGVHKNGEGAETEQIILKRYNVGNGEWEGVEISKKGLDESFFYSIFLNYSIHAFNTLDYREDKTNDVELKRDWLNACFHKNDGYTAPLVLNPKRNKGVIDINNENHLAKSRLISLILTSDNTESTYTYINDRYSISSIVLKFDQKSVDRKYDEIFQEYKNGGIEIAPQAQSVVTEAIKELWIEKYEIDTISDVIGEIALKYIVYKTLSIAKTYEDIFIFGMTLDPILYGNKDKDEWKNEIKIFIDEIYDDPSHITFRLKQTLAFLKYRTYNRVTVDKPKTYTVEDLSSLIDGQKIEHPWAIDHFVPPPIFDTKIMVKDNLTGEEFPLSQLSSGERQLAYAVSTIIYHLRNLNSVPLKDLLDFPERLKYQYANIVLDEIELYFHPGYQRLFVDHLIKCLEIANLKEIRGINIMMITHSPFILSDIPKSNVLFLKDGLPDFEMQENTFAANIHSMLQNGFFMEDGTMGSFAKKKVNELFRSLHENDAKPDIKDEILLVSEPILRSQLLRMYNDLYGENPDIQRLFGIINKLQSELNQLKNDQNQKR